MSTPFCNCSSNCDLYCRFSGGGDLHIQKSIESPFVEPLILVTNSNVEEQSSNDNETTEVEPTVASSDKLSPPSPGAARLATVTLVVEGKRDIPYPKQQLNFLK